MALGSEQPSEREFVEFVQEIARRLQLGEIIRDFRVSSRTRADLVIRQGESVALVEIKLVTPQTEYRVADALAQLFELRREYSYLETGESVRLILAMPGRLSPIYRSQLTDVSVEIWDNDWFEQSADRVGMEDEFRYFSNEESGSTPESSVVTLSERLAALPCGDARWYEYETLCKEVFTKLFCPPLEPPGSQSSNHSRVNRRDLIFPNYATTGTWQFMREHYKADYVKPADSAAEITIREQWFLYQKLILVVDDNDLFQMLTAHDANSMPDRVIRQKIEDFRISI